VCPGTDLTSGEIEGAPLDRRAKRRRDTMAEIIDAAWDLCREEGLHALTMRALGERVGMKAQSLYSYFASKDEIYDAMFADGNRAFLDLIDEVAAPQRDARTSAEITVRTFLRFCTADATRFQLLFQRTIPGFEPSPESYTIAAEAFDRLRRQLREIGVEDDGAVDLWTAVTTGLASQQIANDPGGDRWTRLADRAVSMLLAETSPTVQEEHSQP
jgi:AcrR family transcriptional regulator